jgi:general secretion pathway protein G
VKKISIAVIFILFAAHEAAQASGNMVEADLIGLSAAVEVYRITTGTLPPCEAGLDALVRRPKSLKAETPWNPIMNKIPLDPWDRPYVLIVDPGLQKGYGIYGKGPDGISRTVGNDPDDYNTWSPTRRGIQTNPTKSMPWLWPAGIVTCLACFYLGVRTERFWNSAHQKESSTN